MNTFATAYAQADIFGKVIFLALFTLSAICWLVLLHKWWLTFKIERISKAFQKRLLGTKDSVLSYVAEQTHPFASIFASLKEKAAEILEKNHFYAQAGHLSTADLDLLESHVLTTISEETKKLEKNLFILMIITPLAPFVGLLGTVWGILITFGELYKGGMVSTNSMMLGGLSTALATTVLGLVIAIPALIANIYLKTKVRILSTDMRNFLYRLLSKIELQYRKVDA